MSEGAKGNGRRAKEEDHYRRGVERIGVSEDQDLRTVSSHVSSHVSNHVSDLVLVE